MARSPIAASLLALLFSAALAAQSSSPAGNSSTPRDASGLPPAPTGNNSGAPGPAPSAPGNIAQPPEASTGNPPSATTGTVSSPATSPAKPEILAPVTPPSAPLQPKTEILDSSATGGSLTTDGHDPILDPPPMPGGITTLVGGTISDVDRLRNHLTVHVFGGNKWKVNFDERTHIFQNGVPTTQLALKKGERVYVDTMLDNNRHEVFARNIRVGVAAVPADADGQIVDVDTKRGVLTFRDSINSAPVRFSVDQQTRISNGNTPATLQSLRPGALVRVRFAPESPNRGLAREISVLAAPGSAFTFTGRITYLDLHRGLLAVQNTTDDKNYTIHFAPTSTQARESLAVGTEVNIVASFDGSQYVAQTLSPISGQPKMPSRD